MFNIAVQQICMAWFVKLHITLYINLFFLPQVLFFVSFYNYNIIYKYITTFYLCILYSREHFDDDFIKYQIKWLLLRIHHYLLSKSLCLSQEKKKKKKKHALRANWHEDELEFGLQSKCMVTWLVSHWIDCVRHFSSTMVAVFFLLFFTWVSIRLKINGDCLYVPTICMSNKIDSFLSTILMISWLYIYAV